MEQEIDSAKDRKTKSRLSSAKSEARNSQVDVKMMERSLFDPNSLVVKTAKN